MFPRIITTAMVTAIALSLTAGPVMAAPPAAKAIKKVERAEKRAESAAERAAKAKARVPITGDITATSGTTLPLTLTVKPKKSDAAVITITEKTTCSDRFGKAMPCIALALGDTVLVRGERNTVGVMIATKVRNFSVTRMAFPGKVKTIDVITNTLTIDGKRLGDLVIQTNPTTKYFLKGKEDGSLATLCVGAKVTVFGTRHQVGPITAERVHVAAGTLEKCVPPPPPAPVTPPITPPTP